MLRLQNDVPCYGLFIDFSNAYNSVPHTRLFDKLRNKKILTEQEVDFLECLYSRYRIKIGKNYLKVNKGVAQGSLISPALFDIYIEALSDEANINLEHLRYYADDVLALCSDDE